MAILKFVLAVVAHLNPPRTSRATEEEHHFSWILHAR